MAQSAALKQLQSPALVSFPPDYFFSSVVPEPSTEHRSSKERASRSDDRNSRIPPREESTRSIAREQTVSDHQGSSVVGTGSEAANAEQNFSNGERSASEDDMDEFYALAPLQEDSFSDADVEDQLQTPSGHAERGARTNVQNTGTGGGIGRRTAGPPPSTARRRRLLSFSRSPWPVADGWEVHLTPTHSVTANRRGTASSRRHALQRGLDGIGEDGRENDGGGTPAGLSPADGVRTQLARRMLPSPLPSDGHASTTEASQSGDSH